MRGEQPLEPSAGAPSFVCSLRSQPPSPDRGKALVETASSMVEGSILALSVTCGDSSPKGRALGKTKDFAVLPKPLPLTDFPRSGEDGEAKKGNKVDLRSKDGEGEDAAPLHCSGGPHYPPPGAFFII